MIRNFALICLFEKFVCYLGGNLVSYIFKARAMCGEKEEEAPPLSASKAMIYFEYGRITTIAGFLALVTI